MYRTLIAIISLFTLVTLPLQAKKPQSIVDPHYDYRTHPTQTVKKIERSDTATILTIQAQLHPNWWIEVGRTAQLIDTKSNDTLAVRYADGITLGKKFYLPQSGETTYRLVFPPLGKDATKVDFFQFGPKRSCRTYGLRADGTKPSTGNPTLDALQGNWFASDGSGDWMIGFDGDLVVWDKDFWHTTVLDRKGVMELVNRADNSLRDTIAIQINRDGSCTVGKVGAKGIRAVREQKMAPNGPRTADDDKSWSEIEMLTSGKALVRGVISGYNPALGWTKGQISVDNAFTQADSRNFLIDVAPDGTFQTEVELPFPSEVLIALNDRYSRCHVAPSDTIVLCVKYDELSRSLNGFRMDYSGTLFMGNHARLNTQTNRYYDAIPVVSTQEQYRTMGYREFDTWYKKSSAERMARKEQYIKANNLTRKAIDYIRLSHALEVADLKISYPSQRGYHLNQDSTIIDRDLNLPASFFRLDENFPIDDPKLVTVRNSYFLANGIEFCQIAKGASMMIDISTMERLSGQTFPPEVHAVADSMKRGLIEVNKNNANYYFPFMFLFQNGTDEYRLFMQKIKLSQVSQVLNDSLGIAKGSFFGDQIKASVAKRNMHRLLNATQMALILSEFTHPEAIKWVIDANEKHRPAVVEPVAMEKKEIETTKDNSKDTDAQALLTKVLAPYAGKVIYLDFWAMWCGPCRGGMEGSYRVKDLVSGNKDIVFAYITTEKDSPKASREKFIAENKITGEFLLISRDEWAVLTTHFNISGIPHYMIVGRDGKVVDPHCNLSGNTLVDRLKELAEAN